MRLAVPGPTGREPSSFAAPRWAARRGAQRRRKQRDPRRRPLTVTGSTRPRSVTAPSPPGSSCTSRPRPAGSKSLPPAHHWPGAVRAPPAGTPVAPRRPPDDPPGPRRVDQALRLGSGSGCCSAPAVIARIHGPAHRFRGQATVRPDPPGRDPQFSSRSPGHRRSTVLFLILGIIGMTQDTGTVRPTPVPGRAAAGPRRRGKADGLRARRRPVRARRPGCERPRRPDLRRARGAAPSLANDNLEVLCSSGLVLVVLP